MPDDRQLLAEADVPFWDRPLSLDFQGFFNSLAKATTFSVLGKWDDASINALEALAATGITRTPSQLAGVLLKRSMSTAIYTLLRDYLRDFSEDLPEGTAAFCEQIDREVSTAGILLDQSFLEHPRDIAIVDLFRAKLSAWLSYRKIGSHHPDTIAARLPDYFVWALHREFQAQEVDYSPLLSTINTPVADAWRKTRTWESYRNEFRKQLAEPVFGEAFSLPQVFVWPRGFYEIRSDNDDRRRVRSDPSGSADVLDLATKRSVIDLREALDSWLEGDTVSEDEQRADSIRLLSGDPGSGKSSFTRMYAHYRMEKGDHVLVVPLHRLNVQGEFGNELETFCREHDNCPTGLLNAATAEKRLLLVLDGLDELSKQGAIGASIANAFVEEVIRKTNNRNSQTLRVRVIISGRPIAVQNVTDKFRGEGQVLTLLPYYHYDDRASRRHHLGAQEVEYVGRTHLLEIDLRQEWWEKYSACTGRASQLPTELSGPELYDLTSQPLLNYLLALVYRQETAADPSERRIDFRGSINRNLIYDVLLDRVYERDWDPAKSHKALGGLGKEDFRDLLEEMALTAWHGRERTTTVSAVREQCKGTYLERVLTEYEKHCADGVGSLFTAFYFRKSARLEGPEPTFEFTHKSFGEYLTALRIVDAVEEIHDAVSKNSRKRVATFSDRSALAAWLRVCGPTTITLDLVEYLRNEFPLRRANGADIAGWQQTLATMLNASLKHGMPCEEILEASTLQEMVRWSRNANVALIALHSCVAALTDEQSDIDWPDDHSAVSWYNDVTNPAVPSANVVRRSLNHLSFDSQELAFGAFLDANFRRSSFRRAVLAGAVCVGACFDSATLNGAVIAGTRLEGASLVGANLADAMFCALGGPHHTDMGMTLIQDADLKDAVLDPDSLGLTVGNPRRLPDGSCPEDGWRKSLEAEDAQSGSS